VNSGFRRTNGVFRMHRVRQGNVDGIHLLQTLIVFVVGEGLIYSILPAKFVTLGDIVTDEGGEFGITFRMRKRGKNRNLRDMAQSNDGIANSFAHAGFRAIRGPISVLGTAIAEKEREVPEGPGEG
jgi:hypothetical protein